MLLRPSTQAVPTRSTPRCLPYCIAMLLPFTLSVFIPDFVRAEVRIVTAQGKHLMSDRDTREDAVRMATEAAKRDALEQVATYLESVTVVDQLHITKDEIRTYTAGLVLILDQRTKVDLEAHRVVVTVDLVAQVDSDEVRRAISALRQNEDARQQLITLRREIDGLHQQLRTVNHALSRASTAEQATHETEHRQRILDQVQSNAMVSQAWTDWVLTSPVVAPLAGLAQTQSLLNLAGGLYPGSPHVQAARQVMSAPRPPVPHRPPTPPAPGSTAPAIPSYQLVPPPGERAHAKTLNEITEDNGVPASQGSDIVTDTRQLSRSSRMSRGTSASSSPASRSTGTAETIMLQNEEISIGGGNGHP
ncbi:conserved exported protein of unknown function [Nitrospira sp. KM1]|nr:conserved exported protein of unknown function [Nitrospira sp. KM1]